MWFKPQALILLYHRVIHLTEDPNLLAVHPDLFEDHIRYLVRHFQVLSLCELMGALSGKKLPERAIAITFDDGYADNLWNAKPILERYGVPATFFIATNYVKQQQEFWWDELAKTLLGPGILPKKLQLSISGKEYGWDLENFCRYTENDSAKYNAWNVTIKDEPTPRHRAFRTLSQLASGLSESERDFLRESLMDLRQDDFSLRNEYRPLLREEIKKLKEGSLAEIGVHTASHSVLSSLSLDLQRKEIEESKIFLEQTLGNPVSQFAYPFGGRNSYTSETIDLLQGFGFSSACAAFPGMIGEKSDWFELPRFNVRNWGVKEFASKLDSQFHA